MKTSILRDRLTDYIQVAEDKKIKAIYTMFENEIEEELSWWMDNDFIKKLDKDFNDWESGKAKGYSIEEVNASIENLRILHTSNK